MITREQKVGAPSARQEMVGCRLFALILLHRNSFRHMIGFVLLLSRDGANADQITVCGEKLLPFWVSCIL